jgi:hypothetical protein
MSRTGQDMGFRRRPPDKKAGPGPYFYAVVPMGGGS